MIYLDSSLNLWFFRILFGWKCKIWWLCLIFVLCCMWHIPNLNQSNNCTENEVIGQNHKTRLCLMYVCCIFLKNFFVHLFSCFIYVFYSYIFIFNCLCVCNVSFKLVEFIWFLLHISFQYIFNSFAWWV